MLYLGILTIALAWHSSATVWNKRDHAANRTVRNFARQATMRIGGGISVYTAFLACGAVNWFSALAFNPVLWPIPTILDVGYMIRHQWKVFRQRQRAGRSAEMVWGRHLDMLVPLRRP